ncbi:MAG: transglutaminase-like domain-containing protein [Rhodocyclaceae bacterium]|nr:transglutaminase-like domain-containing protein [Rhodocyclaceae bacterium]
MSDHFRQENFLYLDAAVLLGEKQHRPAPVRNTAVSCEHYACLRLLMRAAGVPARVVTGLPGQRGETN